MDVRKGQQCNTWHDLKMISRLVNSVASVDFLVLILALEFCGLTTKRSRMKSMGNSFFLFLQLFCKSEIILKQNIFFISGEINFII